MIDRFDPLNELFFRKSIKQARLRTTIFPFIAVGGTLGQIFLLLIGGKLIIEKTLSIGDFVAMSSYVALLSWPTASLAWIINIIQRGKSSWSRVESILNQKVDFPFNFESKSSSISLLINPRITIKNLSFSYNTLSESTTNQVVLNNVSFDIQPGMVLGVFGPSGSGKSTLARILAGIEPIQNDTYLLNNKCFNQWDIAEFRHQISYVDQQPFLFSVPIVENIDFMQNNHNMETIKAMTTLAAVDGDIQRFSDQYNTLVGERGVVLSGGQKTRLALARALFKPHSLLILDDVLSAVDHETEQELISNLQNDKMARTSVIISHRISALTQCDHIIVLDKGRIVDQGSHQDLLASEGLYHYSWQYQKMTNE
jgi:ATP-binding cassette subfamily B multidrug efflux pump